MVLCALLFIHGKSSFILCWSIQGVGIQHKHHHYKYVLNNLGIWVKRKMQNIARVGAKYIIVNIL